MRCEICGRDNLTAKELSVHKKYYVHKQIVGSQQLQKVSAGACPDCGGTLFYQEGCVKCYCGYSKCG